MASCSTKGLYKVFGQVLVTVRDRFNGSAVGDGKHVVGHCLGAVLPYVALTLTTAGTLPSLHPAVPAGHTSITTLLLRTVSGTCSVAGVAASVCNNPMIS
jgi:hypothetical protein